MSRWRKFGNWATLRALVLPVTWAPMGWNVVPAPEYTVSYIALSTHPDIFL